MGGGGAVLSPEARLVLASAGRGTDAELRALLHRDLDWGKVLWLAEHERATAVLWRRLNEMDAREVPAEAAEQLQRMSMVSDFRMLHLQERLREAVRRLSQEGIEVVLLKGAALAESVYGSFTERPMNDLDILVPAERAQDARDCLLGAGWAGEVDDRLARMYEHHHHLPPLIDASGTEVKLELHTSLFLAGHPFALTAERVWAGRQPVQVGGVASYVPRTHDMLLHACLHFAWSNQLRSGAWRTFRDVERLATHPGMEWGAFAAVAEENRAGTLCYWTFRLARRLVGVPIPDAVLASLSPGWPEPVLRRLEWHFVHHILATEWICPSVTVGYWMWQLGMRPRRSGYGTARPWGYEDRIQVSWSEELRATDKITNQLRQLPRWGRYLRVLLQPAG